MLEKGQIWRHIKTGHFYFIAGFCKLEATCEDAVLYQKLDDPHSPIWARSECEFLDGRFIQHIGADVRSRRSDGSIIHPYAPDDNPLNSIPVEGIIG